MHYESHLVAFLDILGFSNICLNSEASEKDRKSLFSIFEYCDQIKSSFSESNGKESIQSTVLSDSIVLTLKTESENPTIKEIRNFALSAGKFQYHLGENGFWLRGGISCGPLYVNLEDKQIFGPALIHAVNLEKNVAKYPRIIADSSIMIKAGFQNAIEFKTSVNRSEQQDRFRPFYEMSNLIDDIGVPQIPNDVPFIIDFISTVRPDSPVKLAEFVAKGLRGPILHYEKYRWLANYILAHYHQTYLGLGPHRQELEILLS